MSAKGIIEDLYLSSWWIAPGGKVIDVHGQSHAAWAQEFLNQAIPKEGEEDPARDEAMRDMFAKGYVRAVEEDGEIRVNTSLWGRSRARVSPAQRKALEYLAAERGCDLVDADGSVLWSRVRESFAYSAEGRDDPFKLGDNYWMTPDGRLLDVWNTEHNEWAKHHLGKGRDRLLASGWLRVVSVAPMMLPGYEDRRLISVSGGKMPNRAQRAALERVAIASDAKLQADVGDRAPVALYEPPVQESFADVAELTGKELKGGEWVAFADDSGSLGIPRAEMPQVKAEHRGALTRFLNGKGIESEEDEVEPGKLKPTQKEWSPEKVEGAREHKGGDRAILVSGDNFVVDGHHQWLARLWDKADEPMRVIRYHAKIREVLKAVAEFPSAEQAAGATKVKEALEPSIFDLGSDYWIDPAGNLFVVPRGGFKPGHHHWAMANKGRTVGDLVSAGWRCVVSRVDDEGKRVIYVRDQPSRAQRAALERAAIEASAWLYADVTRMRDGLQELYRPPSEIREAKIDMDQGGYWMEPSGKMHDVDEEHGSHAEWATDRGESVESLIGAGWIRVVTAIGNQRAIYAAGGALNRHQREILEMAAIENEAKLIWDRAGYGENMDDSKRWDVLYEPPVAEASASRRIIEAEDYSVGDKFEFGNNYWIDPHGDLRDCEGVEHWEWAEMTFGEGVNPAADGWCRVVSAREPSGRKVIWVSDGRPNRAQMATLERAAIEAEAWLMQDYGKKRGMSTRPEKVLYQPPEGQP